MGKRVFEVAKELGVDHRELLTKCDELRINVRNYMSELKGADVDKLRAAYGGPKGGRVEEKVQAPGVVRRRRKARPADRAEPAARPQPAKPSPTPAAAPAAVRPAPAAEPEPVKAAPASAVEVEPAKVVEAPAAAPAPEAAKPEATKPVVEAPEAAKPMSEPAEAAATPVKRARPTAEKARVLSRPERRRVAPGAARVLSRPDSPAPKPRKPKKAVPTMPQGPVGDAITRRMKGLRPAHETLLRKPGAEPEPETPPEAEAVAPEPEVKAPEKPSKKAAREKGGERNAAKARAAKAKAAEAKPEDGKPAEKAPEQGDEAAKAKPEDGRPREQKLAPSVTRRAPKKRPDKAASAVRAPQARPKAAGAAAGGAKILGTIPLEQLQRRTRPPARRGPGGRPGGRPGGPPGRGPRGPAGPGVGGGAGAAMPPPMPGRGGDTRRRRGGGPPNREADRRPRTGGGGGGGAGGGRGRRRRVFNRDDIYKGSSRLGRGRRRKMSSRKGAKTQLTTPAAHKRVVKVNGTISVAELGKQLGVKGTELVRKLMGMGVMATLNQQVDLDTATLIATEYDYEAKDVSFDEAAVLSGPVAAEKVEADPDAKLRAPVVTIMGHVDHGKTTLLDRIRSADVASGEAGGITQHVGAYRVETGQGPVVFLDTPGHAAFTAMRARGASVTDLVVLVVAADDGVMPQTEESINHARAAGVPLIVAINKVDKPGVDPERIKQELTKYELVPEEWGGETMMLPVSALRGDGVDELLEALALQAEVLELKANPKKDAYGRVVEARVDKGRGSVATVLVQEGTLRVGAYMVAGEQYGRVRAMIDPRGKRVKEAGPSTPVEVLGLGGLPTAGDAFYTAKKEKDAKRVAAHRESETKRGASSSRTSGMDLLAMMGKKEREKQNVILKADVSGSLEALKGSLEQLATDEVEVKLVHSGVGGISASDIDLASASDSVVIGFNCTADNKAKRAADQAGVKIVTFSVIYDVLDTVKEMLSGLLEPETVEETLGKAEVRAVFHIQRVGPVAGCMVTDGKMLRGSIGRVIRGGVTFHEGKLSTLKRFKDDVREVATGYECGIAVDGYKDIQEGDIIQAVELKQIKRTID